MPISKSRLHNVTTTCTSAKNCCSTCDKRIYKTCPRLICDLCEEFKHFSCNRLSKKDAEHIVNSNIDWTCPSCIESILPVNAFSNSNHVAKPRFKVQCEHCKGYAHKESNVKTCHQCASKVHLKCFRHNLGCLKCCEDIIPGYHCTTYELTGNYGPLNKIVHNPYGVSDNSNCIGDNFESRDEHSELWSQVSDALINCKYQQLTNVKAPRKNELNILSLNIRSLYKYVGAIREEINQYTKFDVLCFCETNCIPDNLPNGVRDILIDDFYEPITSNPTRKSGKGGGLAIYVNKRVCDMKDIEIFDPDKNNTQKIESGEFQFIKIHNCKGFKQTKIISNVYRSPSKRPQSFLQNLDSITRKLSGRHGKKHVCLVGDLNIDLIQHDSDRSAQELVDNMASCGFLQLISRPTRITDHSATLIDHVFTNNLENTLSCNVITIDLSDHLGTSISISLGNSTTKAVKFSRKENESTGRRIYNEACNLKFSELIGAQNWDAVLTDSTLDASIQFEKFLTIYNGIYEEAYPLMKSRNLRRNERRDPKPWILPWLEDACSRKNRLFADSIADTSDELTLKYKKLEKFCHKHINIAKRKYYKKYFEQNKSNSIKQWQMINQLLNRGKQRRDPIKLKDHTGAIVSSPLSVAENFNSYFSSIAANLKSKHLNTCPGTVTENFSKFLKNPAKSSMFLTPTHDEEVGEIITNLKNKATLDTKISSLKLATRFPSFTCVIASLVNNSFTQGVYPQALKTARVVPIHKGGSKSEVSNYRPISLLSSFSKIYEKLMHARLIGYFDSNNLLYDAQFGFRPGRSCEHALLTAQHHLLSSMSKKQVSLLLLIDFSKAFDVIEHEILLSKLMHYGVRGIVLDWFKSYLKGRTQFVAIENVDSSPKHIEYGVPQGSILGPLLFVIYINDIPNIAEIAKFILYADDANIIVTADTLENAYDKLEVLTKSLVSWVGLNGLCLNLKKTNYMIFTRKRNLKIREVTISGTIIERKPTARFLGVIVDEKLNWSEHISAVRTKMCRYVGIMCKIKHHVPTKVMLQMYHSFIQSHVNFCSLVWGFSCKSNIESLFRMQKRGIRAVIPGFVNYYYKDGQLPTHTKTAFSTHKILTIHGIVVKNLLIFLHKLKYHSTSLPTTVSNTMHTDAPITLDPPTDNNLTWYNEHNDSWFRNSLFFKAPLLYRSYPNLTENADHLTNLNLKKLLKKRLLELQCSGDKDEWPLFPLYSIDGLRKSERNRR